MGRYCYICKMDAGTIEGVTLHKFPSDEYVKNKWIKALGRDIKLCHRICSRHFEETDFYYKLYGEQYRRYLKRTAVPRICIEIVDVKSKILDLDDDDNSSVIQSEPGSECNADANADNVIDVDDDDDNFSEVNILGEEVQNEIEEIEECPATPSSPEKNATLAQIYNNTVVKGAKRHYAEPRYVGDLTREDFTSEYGYSVVMKFYQETKRTNKILNSRIKKLTLQLSSQRALLNYLKEKGIINRTS